MSPFLSIVPVNGAGKFSLGSTTMLGNTVRGISTSNRACEIMRFEFPIDGPVTELSPEFIPNLLPVPSIPLISRSSMFRAFNLKRIPFLESPTIFMLRHDWLLNTLPIGGSLTSVILAFWQDLMFASIAPVCERDSKKELFLLRSFRKSCLRSPPRMENDPPKTPGVAAKPSQTGRNPHLECGECSGNIRCLQKCRISVPNQVAVMSGTYDDLLCELSEIPISGNSASPQSRNSGLCQAKFQ